MSLIQPRQWDAPRLDRLAALLREETQQSGCAPTDTWTSAYYPHLTATALAARS